MDNYMNFLKRMAKLNGETQWNALALKSHFTDLLSVFVNMFDYDGMYEGFFKRTLAEALAITGYAMTTKDEQGELVTCPCSPKGIPNNNGEYTEFIGNTYNGKVFERTKDVDCVIWYNNSLQSPDFDVIRYAEMLTEIDKSMLLNVIYSRLLPMPLVKDTKTLESVNTAIDSIMQGKLKTILDSNIKIDDLIGSDKVVDTLELSNPDQADKIQYLSKLYEDILDRFYTKYGHNFSNNSGKMAQQSIKEIEGAESYSWIICNDMLNNRKEAIEKVNAMFGLSASVDFSISWAVQFEQFKEQPQEEPSEEPKEEPKEELSEGKGDE